MAFRFPYPDFENGEFTLLKINGKAPPKRASLGLTQSLDTIDNGSIRPTLSGGLRYYGIPSLSERYSSTIAFGDVFPIQMMKRGQVYTISSCSEIILPGLKTQAQLNRPAAPGSIRYLNSDMRPIGDEDGGYADPADVEWTWFLPVLSMMAFGHSSTPDKWGRTTSGSVLLQEDKIL